MLYNVIMILLGPQLFSNLIKRYKATQFTLVHRVHVLECHDDFIEANHHNYALTSLKGTMQQNLQQFKLHTFKCNNDVSFRYSKE